MEVDLSKELATPSKHLKEESTEEIQVILKSNSEFYITLFTSFFSSSI